MRGNGPVSTIVSNHIGFFDIMALMCSPLHPGFTPKIELYNVPITGSLALGLQSLFIDRSADLSNRDAVLDQIVKRQEAIEDHNYPFNPMCLFSEGTTTNNTALLKFKRGAFWGMRTITPVYNKVYPEDPMVSPHYDVVGFWMLVILYVSSPQVYRSHLYILPPFTPNQHMLKTQAHRSPNNEAWEIYAECIRDAMSKHSGFLKVDTPVRDKLKYEDMMEAKTDSCTIDGQTYVYPGSQAAAEREKLEEDK